MARCASGLLFVNIILWLLTREPRSGFSFSSDRNVLCGCLNSCNIDGKTTKHRTFRVSVQIFWIFTVCGSHLPVTEGFLLSPRAYTMSLLNQAEREEHRNGTV